MLRRLFKSFINYVFYPKRFRWVLIKQRPFNVPPYKVKVKFDRHKYLQAKQVLESVNVDKELSNVSL